MKLTEEDLLSAVKVYDFVIAHWRKHTYAPTIREIMSALSYGTTKVYRLLDILVELDYITYTGNISRSIVPNSVRDVLSDSDNIHERGDRELSMG